jgi:ABC-2 type transport system permease protein
MFWHIFIHRLKCIVRDRQLVFWTFLYPLVLATLFGLAFNNISSSDRFSSIPIAVVNNAEYARETTFQSVLASHSDTAASGDKLFSVTLAPDEQTAEQSLKSNGIKGYILFQNGAHVIVKDSGISQTILKQFMDSYLEGASAYATIIKANPQAAAGFRGGESKSYLKEVAPGKAPPNNTLTYFYGLIAMASLFGGFWGMKETSDIQADLSPQGARMNLAPVHKLKVFGYSFLAAIAVHFASLLLLVAYLAFVLKVAFGAQIVFILIACLAGAVTGVSFGAMCTAVVKNEHMKIAVLIVGSIILSFLAGLMVSDIKYLVNKAVPVLAYLNPASLVSDAFYSLYYYSSYTKFFESIGLLLGLSGVFYLIVYFKMRRQKYASL